MNLYVAICLLAVSATANADGALGLGGLGGLGGGLVYAPGHASADYYAYPRYAFEYSVKDPHTGDNKAQWEKRDGDVVKGAYSLVEPDGSLRVVEYWADDKSGFNAVVKKLGPNLHPTSVHAAPIYKAPIPVLSHGPVVSPISIGPVANLGHLAGAPLISGPIHGPALSTQNLIKEAVPIIKPIAPVPIIKQALPVPIIREPIHAAPISAPYYGHDVSPYLLRQPIINRPILTEQLLPGPIYKSGPIYGKPLGPLPIYKAPLPIYKEAVPIYKEAVPLPLLRGPELGPIGDWQVIGKGPIGPWESLGHGKGLLGPLGPLPLGGHGLIKGPIGPAPLPYDIIEKAPLLPAWNGPLDYPLYEGGYKH